MADFTGSAVGESWRTRLAKNVYDLGFFAMVGAISAGVVFYSGGGVRTELASKAALAAAPEVFAGLAIWLANASPFLNRHSFVRYLAIGGPAMILGGVIRLLLTRHFGV